MRRGCESHTSPDDTTARWLDVWQNPHSRRENQFDYVFAPPIAKNGSFQAGPPKLTSRFKVWDKAMTIDGHVRWRCSLPAAASSDGAFVAPTFRTRCSAQE